MSHPRSPAVAGQFYPSQANELATAVNEMLQQADGATQQRPKVLIVPHAGYPYSGPVAASAYALLKPWRQQIRRVVLLGPAHRMGFHGLAISSATAFLTPLGPVPLDQQSIRQISPLPQVHQLDQAHALEHSLEVQLPFLQQVLESFQLVPLVVGEASAEEVAEVLEGLWGGDETLILLSTDLSHYLDYHTAQQRDQASSEAILRLDGEALGYEDACGRNPLKGLLQLARQRGMAVELLDLRNSGDTAGSRDRVVGYGAYALTEPPAAEQQ